METQLGLARTSSLAFGPEVELINQLINQPAYQFCLLAKIVYFLWWGIEFRK